MSLQELVISTETGWGEANDGDIGNPEGLRFINELEFRQNVAIEAWSLKNPQVHYNFRRIDVGGRPNRPTRHTLLL